MKKGFTLIELMIVIAIIALLAAVALPKFSSASEAAKVANVQGNLANLRTALAINYAKHRTYPILGAAGIREAGTINPNSTFADYYSKSTMPETPAGENVTSPSNDVADATNTNGGWFYDDATGEIHANLPSDAYGDDIDWTEE